MIPISGTKKMVEVLEAGVIIALAAWVLTQIQLIRTYRRVGQAQVAIKQDIDEKRVETQRFVDERLTKIEGLMGQHQASLTAQIPPNVHGELEDVRAEIEAINVGLRKELEDLPMRLRMSYQGVAGKAAQHMDGAIRDVVDEAKAMAVADFDPQEALARQAIDWINKPLPKKASPLEEAATIGAKKFLAEFLSNRQSPGSSVTYRVTSKARAISNTEF